MSDNKPVQLNVSAWITEEDKKTDDAIRHTERLLGIFESERNTTLAYLRGYLTALRVISRREDF